MFVETNGYFCYRHECLKMKFTDDTSGIGEIAISSANGSLLGVTGISKYYKSITDFSKDDSNAWL